MLDKLMNLRFSVEDFIQSFFILLLVTGAMHLHLAITSYLLTDSIAMGYLVGIVLIAGLLSFRFTK